MDNNLLYGDFKDITCTVFDAYGNQLLVLVTYNKEYKKDFKVKAATVIDNGKEIQIENLDLIAAQYNDSLYNQVLMDNLGHLEINYD